MTSAARIAGTIVSHGDRVGPKAPTNISVPSTATATKFTELLMRKKATERRAILSAGMPPRLRIHAPRARPPAPLAGANEPAAGPDPPVSPPERPDKGGAKTWGKKTTEGKQDSAPR